MVCSVAEGTQETSQ